ncbi:DNA alkylation repair protein [Sanguibacter sp. 25GB23B1]|uniref:DNA alkylation repair protein n=1 Tax=unclassified Sanguibacter TaxID=2645534 RepID=UPI0032AF9A20
MPAADELIGPSVVAELVDVISRAQPGAPFEHLRACGTTLAPLGLRDRAHALKDALLADVPGETAVEGAAALETLVRRCLLHDRFTGWMVWPVAEAISARALEDRGESGPATVDAALALLADVTGRLTAEFSIRPLLAHDLGRVLTVVETWTAHPDEHVRRLASEGTRRYLPWGTRVPGLMTDATLTVPILDALYRDESEYVRRSVANHLNDLSRTDPSVVVETAGRWLGAPDAHTERLVRHALRTLVKKGDPGALALLGFGPVPGVRVDGPALAATSVTVGGELAFTATVHNTGTAPARVVVDYVVHHRKANGTQTPKVFKITSTTIPAGASLELVRRHSFKVITTRRYHPGEHAIELQVNGVASGRAAFAVHAPTPEDPSSA